MPIRGGTVINIAGTNPVDDPEYRYKMPAVYGKIEGRGNGIKTVIPNISDVGLSLHREAGEVTKFFGTELGAQTTYNPDTDRAVVNGAHTDDTLQDLMHRYIEKFVLCPNCSLPETEYKIKNDCIYHKCAACGSKDMVDMSHKLCTYILAQDKKAKKEAKSKDKKNKKDDKKNKKDKKKDKDKDGSDEEKKKKKDKKKDKKDKKKDKKDKGGNYLEEAMFGKKDDGLDAEADEQDDVDSEAGVDDEGAMRLAVEATKKYIADNSDVSAADLAEVITNQQMASALKSHDKVHIAVQSVLTPQFFKQNEVEKYAPVFSEITNGNSIMERHLIAALEAFSIEKPKSFPVLIKQFYDEDALEEDTILEWAGEGRNDYTLESVDEETRAVLRAEAEPVVVWLQEADSDDEDDEDD
uniref:W2 domain-containing protein n=1 Tax=Cyclophora tenuis TaxID=216820 RepID=A0A7S1D9Q5_CYCTE|mmetsp:Transcript_3100/g.5255  ORF Transcript_3100/g.5255 Transcript_3100/m.5255 type:complete len:410 (+) Transcript_3100:270-1499(+)